MNGDGATPQKSENRSEAQQTPNVTPQADTPPAPAAPITPDADEWDYKPEQSADDMPDLAPSESMTPNFGPALGPQEVTWTASEYVAHDKGFNWYALLVLAAVGLTAIVWFLTKDYISVAVILIVAILLGVAAKRKPRVLEYAVDRDGLEIAGKFYPYAEFKSFSVMEEGAFSSIMLIPLKRFAPPISIYYSPDDEEKIVNVLALHLPIEERQHDMIDRFAKRIRF